MFQLRWDILFHFYLIALSYGLLSFQRVQVHIAQRTTKEIPRNIAYALILLDVWIWWPNNCEFNPWAVSVYNWKGAEQKLDKN